MILWGSVKAFYWKFVPVGKSRSWFLKARQGVFSLFVSIVMKMKNRNVLEKRNFIIFGVTGMIGRGVLQECLLGTGVDAFKYGKF